MKQFFFTTVFWLLLILAVPARSFAITSDHTTIEEKEGEELYQKLTNKEISCSDLSEENFAALGEFFMGRMLAPNRSEASGAGIEQSHSSMNKMMEQMMGKEGEEQMHIVMGKRMSGCDISTSLPQNLQNMMGGMIGMMTPRSLGFMGQEGGGNPMMGNFMGMGWWGWNLWWLFTILFLILTVLAIIALGKWIITGGKTTSPKTPLEILKERLAKGEIDKKEFEELKKKLER